MSDTERSPLLARQHEEQAPNESSPLLSNHHESEHDGDTNQRRNSSSDPVKDHHSTKRKWRWPSLIAILVLAASVVVIIVLGFIVPPAVKQYAETAAVLEPTSLSLESLTADGVRARIQANFRLDGARVTDDNARRIGRLATGIMRHLGTEETRLYVRLPNYDNALLGSAIVPPLSLDLVDGHNNQLDFVADVTPGDAELMRKIVNEWLDGKLDQLKVNGAASLSLKSGILPLGTHDVVETMVFEAKEIPSIPEYKIQNLVFHDVPLGDGGRMGVGANVSITAHNDYPVGLDVPSLAFEVLVPNCNPSEPNIKVASAITSIIQVRPKSDVTAEAEGVIRELPETLTRACPDTELSPLDNFMKHYLHGEDARVFVRGKASEQSDLPKWVGEFLESITVPVEFPGRNFDNFIRNFSLTDVDFKMPSPFADPNDPNAKYHSSAKKGSAAAAFEALVVHVDTDLRFNPPPPQLPSPPHSSSPPTTSSSSSSSSPRCCSPAAARLLDRYRARFPNVSFACVHLSRALRLRTVDWAALLPPGPQKPEETLEQANDANGKNGNGENSDDLERLRRFLDRLPSATARADVTRLLVRHVLLDMALAGSYSALLLGHSTTALAALTLAEVANGRGYSVPWQVNDGLYPVRTYGDDSNSNGPSGGDGAAEEEGQQQQQQQRNAAEEVQQEGTRGKKEKETTLAHVPVFYPMREVFGAEITQYLDLAPELGELVAAAAAVTSSSLSSSGTGTGSIVSHKDLSIAEVMSRYFASVEGPYEGIVANVVRTTGKLDRTAPSSSSSAPGAGLCGLCGMALDEQGDSRWAGELGDEEEEEDDGDCIPGRSPRARLCYGCKRSVNG